MILKMFLFLFLLVFEGVNSVEIDTPDIDETNEISINPPYGWGYRTFPGNNGLLGAFWPSKTTFNLTQTAIFVFIQNNDFKIPKIPDNINLFREKCTKAKFHFGNKNRDVTDSIYETYFAGKCGRTMILLEDSIEQYKIIIALIGAKSVTKKQLVDAKTVLLSHKKEIKKQIENKLQNDSINLDNLEYDDEENGNEEDDNEEEDD